MSGLGSNASWSECSTTSPRWPDIGPPQTAGRMIVPFVRQLTVAGQVVDVAVEPERSGAVALWPSIGEYPCYDDTLYTALSTDEERNQRFGAALEGLAPGRTVLDLGTGHDLLWARKAVTAGAQRVIALEEMQSSFAHAARSLRRDDPISLIRGSSTELEFAPRADVCVAEIIGSFAGAEGAAVVLADARQRHLVPGGVVIPNRAVTQAAAVNIAALLNGRSPAFAVESLDYLAVIFESVGRPFDVRLRLKNVCSDILLSNTSPIEDLCFNGDLKTSQEHSVRLDIQRAGTVDGVLTWIQLWCLPGDEPLDALRDSTSWASVYFPLFDAPVDVEPGDSLDLVVTTVVGSDGIHPDYRFEGTIYRRSGPVAGSFESKYHGAGFRSSSVYHALFPEMKASPSRERRHD